MVADDVIGTGEVGNSPSHFEDAVEGAGAQIQIGHGELEQLHGGSIYLTVGFQFATAHPGVARHLGILRKSSLLALPSGDDAHSNFGRTLTCPLR